MPDVGHLFELFQRWVPDTATQQDILAANPAKLYDFRASDGVRAGSGSESASMMRQSRTRGP